MENIQTEFNSGARDSEFFQLYMDSHKNLYAYILAMVHNQADASDILQETATAMWRNFGEYDRSKKFQAWGIAISRNLIKKHFRTRRNTKIQFDDELIGKIETFTIEEIANSNTKMEALKRCCEKLGDDNQLLLQLRYDKGMTIKSIAAKLGRPIAGLYKRYSRLHQTLLSCIEGRISSGEVL
ncbi:MAG: sigma-70 family RNA polymerase sigma factor [Sedimentisphaerales bacterium]|nr:sigma-70 family RNA polymerase sigma factor [Sedimentisphaerales bacterium]MBN2841668.1 sigma-70 family RNA polymerase sigma factor [Sedimentisphaerales bacterium]